MAEETEIKKSKPDSSSQAPDTGQAFVKKWQQRRLVRQETLLKEGGKGGMVYSAIFAVTVVFAAAIILLSIYFRPVYLDIRHKHENRRDIFARKCIERARSINEDSTNIEELNRASRFLHLAIDNAEQTDTKNDASLAMGEYLLARARHDPIPYALMAKQYLLALLDVETRSQERIRAYKALIVIAYLTKDFNAMQTAYREVAPLINDTDELGRILLLKAEICLEKGTWRDMRMILAQAGPIVEDPRRKNEFDMLEAMADEQVLLSEDWFDEWKADRENMTDDEKLRAELFEQTIKQFRTLSESGVVRVKAEVFFRIARLYFHEGMFEKARTAFGDFLQLEPVVHQAETLLMMARTARTLGRLPEAEEMISSFLTQFPWESAAEDEFIAVVDESIRQGRLEQALTLIENYPRLPTSEGTLSELLCKAGQLAASLGRHDQARDYFERVISLNARNDLVVTAMLALVNIDLALNDLDGAREWLLSYLNRFPFEVKQGDALFALLDIDIRRNAAMADILNVAVTAVNECPEDPRTAAALMLVAHEIEDAGLFELAAEQYNKVALLYYVHKTNNPEHADEATAFRAMLGNARCLMKLGDRQHEAGQILRKLCSDTAPGPLRSEALNLWAMLALSQDQKTEARRRFSLIKEEDSSPEARACAIVQLALLDMQETGNSTEALGKVASALSSLNPAARAKMAPTAWQDCFDLLARMREVDGLQLVFNEIVKSGSLDPDSISTLNFRLGSIILADKGIPEFIARMEKNNDLMLANKMEPGPEILELLDHARNIETQKVNIEKL